jgi:predicted metal-dependent hydrolase
VAETLHVAGIEVNLTRKRVKNINLRISPSDGKVVVSAPLWVNERSIASFIYEKQAWIRSHQRRLEDSPAGKVSVPKSVTPEQKKILFQKIDEETRRLIRFWEPRLEVKVKKLTYRFMTSRWGSCTPAKGSIRINLNLGNYPQACLEYVVVHEMCHLLQSGHGARFWALMDEFLPDWKKRKALLK